LSPTLALIALALAHPIGAAGPVASAGKASASVAGPLRCDRLAPEPTGFHARGFGMAAEVFPAGSRQNPGDGPRVYMYEVAHPGLRWEVRATRRWTVELPWAPFPREALVSTEGHVVLLDDDFEANGAHALALVGAGGKPAGAYRLSQLFSEGELQAMDWSDCGIHWRNGASYWFLLDGAPRFYVVLGGELALELDLATGDLRRGAVEEFPRLQAVRATPWPNEEVEVWSTSLRFSSITDLVGGG